MAKYYLVAGESSGDLHASNLVREIKLLDQDANFRGFGGDKMMAQGVEIVQHFKQIAFMGFREVLLHLGIIRRALSFCKKDLKSWHPDVLILVDYPGFNLRIARFAKSIGLKVVYYISPQFWAWKEKRVNSMQKNVDKIITILPFEMDFYARHQIKVDFCGHPLQEHVDSYVRETEVPEDIKAVNNEIVAVLPGSRKQEIENILPMIYETASFFPRHVFVVAASSYLPESIYYKEIRENVKIVFDNAYYILSHAKAGIIKSGTSTLEAALFDLPMLVCYKTTLLNYIITKKLIRVKFISLVNLILGKELVRELIQKDFNTANTTKELTRLLGDDHYRNQIRQGYSNLRDLLNGEGASGRAAKSVYDFLFN